MIAQTIQLALAPVFVLVAIGNIMNILSTRLGRVVDRSRELQEKHAATQGPEHDQIVRMIRVLDKRITVIGRALLMLVLASLSIGVTVVLLFLEEFAHLGPATDCSKRIYRLDRIADVGIDPVFAGNAAGHGSAAHS